MKLLATLLIGCSFVSCDEPPKKPSLEICVIDAANEQCICGFKEPNQPVKNLRREFLVYCERSTAFTPPNWEQYKNYVDGLEAFIERQKGAPKK